MAGTLQFDGIRRLDFTFAPQHALRLQQHAGSAWRGAFGHALKRIVCAMRLRPCIGCPLASVCIHPAFFGAGPDSDGARPYILSPDPTPRDGQLRAGQPFNVRLTVLPGADQAAPYAVRALLDAAAQGLSGRRVAFDCLGITDATTGKKLVPDAPLPAPSSYEPPAPPEYAEVRLTSPLRIRLGGDLVTGRNLQPPHLVGAALRRFRLLGFSVPPQVIKAAKAEAEALTFVDSRLGWLETTRFSTRQNSLMQLGGIVGDAVIDLRNASNVWPLLWSASILHLGKGTTMGFGRIEIHAR